MRTIRFAPASEAFTLAHFATLMAPLERPTASTWRIVAALQRKFEKAGTKVKDNNAIGLHENPKACALAFEEEEFATLRTMVGAAPYGTVGAKAVSGLLDLLDTAKQEEPKPTKK